MSDPTRPPGIRYYACATMMGNWFEDRLREDEEYCEYKRKQSLGETNRTSILTMSMFDKLLYITTPVKPSLSEAGTIHDGDSLMLFNHNESAKCLCTDPRYFVKGTTNSFIATVSTKPKMVARSMFTVRIPDGEALTYGSVFTLVPNDIVSMFSRKPLALTTWVRTPELQPKSRDCQSVGFEPYDESVGESHLDASHMFRAEYPDPAMRVEMEGLVVKPGDLLVIRHCRTGRTLASPGEYVVTDIMPREQEVVCTSTLDQYKRETQVSMWSFEAPGFCPSQNPTDE